MNEFPLLKVEIDWVGRIVVVCLRPRRLEAPAGAWDANVIEQSMAAALMNANL